MHIPRRNEIVPSDRMFVHTVDVEVIVRSVGGDPPVLFEEVVCLFDGVVIASAPLEEESPGLDVDFLEETVVDPPVCWAVYHA